MNIGAFITAFQFLTIIPISTKGPVSKKDLINAPAYFPFVGAFQGLLLAILSFLFLIFLSPDVSAAFILLAYLFTNGGFHQDGLSDTFDAFSVKSSGNNEKDREKRLAVMKDSTVGPIGVIAIFFSFLLKYLLIREVIGLSLYSEKYLIIFLMPLIPKGAMVWAMFSAKSARNDGIGRIFLEHVKWNQLVFSLVSVILIGFTAFFCIKSIAAPLVHWKGCYFSVFLLSQTAILYLFSFLLRRIFSARFGGLTGDNLGAIHELTELSFLIMAVLWL